MDIKTIPTQINAVVGVTATLLTRPANSSFLTIMVDTGNFRLRLGDRTAAGMPGTVDPAASFADGSGAIKIPAGQQVTIAAPATITVKGYAAGDVLTYFYSN